MAHNLLYEKRKKFKCFSKLYLCFHSSCCRLRNTFSLNLFWALQNKQIFLSVGRRWVCDAICIHLFPSIYHASVWFVRNVLEKWKLPIIKLYCQQLITAQPTLPCYADSTSTSDNSSREQYSDSQHLYLIKCIRPNSLQLQTNLQLTYKTYLICFSTKQTCLKAVFVLCTSSGPWSSRIFLSSTRLVLNCWHFFSSAPAQVER